MIVGRHSPADRTKPLRPMLNCHIGFYGEGAVTDGPPTVVSPAVIIARSRRRPLASATWRSTRRLACASWTWSRATAYRKLRNFRELASNQTSRGYKYAPELNEMARCIRAGAMARPIASPTRPSGIRGARRPSRPLRPSSIKPLPDRPELGSNPHSSPRSVSAASSRFASQRQRKNFPPSHPTSTHVYSSK